MDNIKTYYWYCADKHASTITVNFSARKVSVKHHSDIPFECAFHGDEKVSFNSWEYMLSQRCIPQGRPDIKERLGEIGLTEYDPYKIIEKTHGVMCGSPYKLVLVEA